MLAIMRSRSLRQLHSSEALGILSPPSSAPRLEARASGPARTARPTRTMCILRTPLTRRDCRMKRLIRSALILAGAAGLAAARTHVAPNPWTVVVGNGPYAGTYKANAEEVICLHSKQPKMYAASFRDFAAQGAHALGEGGIKVDNPDTPGPKTGDLHVAFGDDAKRSAVYDVYGVPITSRRREKGRTSQAQVKRRTASRFASLRAAWMSRPCEVAPRAS